MFTNQEVLSALEGTGMAGGAGYDKDIEGPGDADVTVTSTGGFYDHATDSGKVVWVPGDEAIELPETITLRATVASDRSTMSEDSPGSGSPGALLYTTEHGQDSEAWDGGGGRGIIQARGSGRLTGLRFRGPYHDHYDDDRYPGYIPLDDEDSYDARQSRRQERYARGMKVYSDDVEVDNCEVYGWPNSAIQMGSNNSDPFSPHLHHLYGHDCMMVAAGYVIDVMRGHPLITDSYFNAARHAINGFGHYNGGYTLEDCLFGPITYSHAVDMHCLSENGSDVTDQSHERWGLRAGGRIEIRRCRFLYDHDMRGGGQEAIVIRGVPDDAVIIEDCGFMHDREPPENSGNSSPGHAWRQVNVNLSSWDFSPDGEKGFTENFRWRNNEFDIETIGFGDGAEEPEPETGHVRYARISGATGEVVDVADEIERATR